MNAQIKKFSQSPHNCNFIDGFCKHFKTVKNYWSYKNFGYTFKVKMLSKLQWCPKPYSLISIHCNLQKKFFNGLEMFPYQKSGEKLLCPLKMTLLWEWKLIFLEWLMNFTCQFVNVCKLQKSFFLLEWP